MKSLEELMAIKEKMKDKVAIRKASDDISLTSRRSTWPASSCEA